MQGVEGFNYRCDCIFMVAVYGSLAESFLICHEGKRFSLYDQMMSYLIKSIDEVKCFIFYTYMFL